MPKSAPSLHALLLALPVVCAALPLHAEGLWRERLRERIHERLQERQENAAGAESAGELDDLGGSAGESCADWSARVKRLERLRNARHSGPQPDMPDLAYGREALETLDVYLPRQKGTAPAPMLLMVHGGGWCVGDKRAAGVVENKARYWGEQGFVFVSVNYPMVSDGKNALAQAHHIAKAAAYVQQRARQWGADPGKLILIGHSAGAHLVSLVNASAPLRQTQGMRPPLATISLDAGAIDVVKQMPNTYSFLKTRYREAFGNSEAAWIAASPYHQLDRQAAPWLGVCSTQRKDDPCAQARAYADKSRTLGLQAQVLAQDKSHGAINKALGQPGGYTDEVANFIHHLMPLTPVKSPL